MPVEDILVSKATIGPWLKLKRCRKRLGIYLSDLGSVPSKTMASLHLHSYYQADTI